MLFPAIEYAFGLFGGISTKRSDFAPILYHLIFRVNKLILFYASVEQLKIMQKQVVMKMKVKV